MEQKSSVAFKERLGWVGQQLAQTLMCFSLDLVGLVASYLMCGPATHQVKPFELNPLVFSQNSDGLFCKMAVNRRLRQIWIRLERKTWILDEEDGHVIFQHDRPLLSFAFNDSGVTFCQGYDYVLKYSQNPSLVPTGVLHSSFVSVSKGMAFYNGQLFRASDKYDSIIVFNESGEMIRQIKCMDANEDGVRFTPEELLIHTSGKMYVTDPYNPSFIQVKTQMHCILSLFFSRY